MGERSATHRSRTAINLMSRTEPPRHRRPGREMEVDLIRVWCFQETGWGASDG